METRSDIELLASFAASRGEPFDGAQGEAAFAEVVNRHQQMVYRTCLRMLNDVHEAHDATQAAFIVLMSKAGKLKREGSLGGWLHAVARRVAMEAIKRRAASARNRDAAAVAAAIDRSENATGTEAVLRCLDEEVERLPAIQRQAVVLRYLEGRGEREAAQLAGCPVGTLSRRASDGIARLRIRLARRGIAAGVPLLAATMEAEAAVAAPESLLSSTMSAVKAYAAAGGATAAVSANVGALTNGVLNMMFWNSIGKVAAFVAAGGMVVGTGVALAQRAAEPRPAGPAAVARAEAGVPLVAEPAQATFREGEPVVVRCTLLNTATSAISLSRVDGAGFTRIGAATHEYRMVAADGGKTFYPVRPKPSRAVRAPERHVTLSLAPGEATSFTATLHSFATTPDADAGDPLPTGKYRFEVSLVPVSAKVTAACDVTIVQAKRIAPDKAEAAARQFLSDRLARQKANAGSDGVFAALEAGQFKVVQTTDSAKARTLVFEAPSGGDKIVQLQVSIDQDSGEVLSKFAGFTIRSRTPPPVGVPRPPSPL